MPGLDALAVGGGVTDPRDARHAVGGLLALQGPTALDVRTGVMVGPGSTQLITGTTRTGPKMSVRLGEHVAVTSRGTANGAYLGPTLEAPLEVDVELAPASGSRIDVVYVKQRDTTSGVPTPDATPGPLYGVLTGQVSTGTPAKPSLAAIVGAEELGTVQVSAGATSTNGSGVIITNTARPTVARGGISPILSSETAAGVYRGQYRDHPTNWLERWSGSSWDRVGPLLLPPARLPLVTGYYNWKDSSPSGGNWERIQVERVGNTAFLRGLIGTPSLSAGTNIIVAAGGIPVPYRPTTNNAMRWCTVNGNNLFRLDINNNGSVILSNPVAIGAGSYLAMDSTWPLVNDV